MDYAQLFLMNNMSSFPPEALPTIRKELESLDEAGQNAVMALDIKNPTTALLFSLFFGGFGVDRFYIGNKGLGFAKLGLTIFGFLTTILLIGFVLLFAVGIWALVDCFLIIGACRQANFERFLYQIHQVKMFQGVRNQAAPVTEAQVEEVVEVLAAEEVVEEVAVEVPSEVAEEAIEEALAEEPLSEAIAPSEGAEAHSEEQV